jgi:hypothetical protein
VNGRGKPAPPLPHYSGEEKEVQVDDFGELHPTTKDRAHPAVVAKTGRH